MDVNQAIEFAYLVNSTYAVKPGDLANAAGRLISAAGRSYVFETLYAICPEAPATTPL